MPETGAAEGCDTTEASRTYFIVLANTRGSLTNLAPLAFFVALMLALDTFLGPNVLISYEDAPEYLGLLVAHLAVICLCVVILPFGLLKRLLFRFQVFFSAVFAGVGALMVYSICFMGVVLASFDGARGEGLSPELFGWAFLGCVMLLGGATWVHIRLLRRRLLTGHSEKRTLGNFQAVSGGSRSKIFWITIPLVLIVPNVVTQGQYLTNAFGLSVLVFLAIVMPSLPVELTYLAYLKSQDKLYWQKLPRRRSKRRRNRATDAVRAEESEDNGRNGS